MIPRSNALAVLTAFVLALASATCSAQQDDAQPTVKVYSVKHSDANEIYRVLETTFEGVDGVRMSVDASTNSLIIMGTVDVQDRAAELIRDIDKKPEHPLIQVHYLEHNRSDVVARSLAMLFKGREDVKISDDQALNSIILLGHQDDLELARDLIKRLDRPNTVTGNPDQKDCILRVTWLVDAGQLSAKQAADLREPRANLGALIEGLKEESMDAVKSVTVCSTRVGLSTSDQPKDFTNSSFRVINEQRHTMEVSGRIKQTPDGKYELQIAIDLKDALVGQRYSSTFSLPKNHPLALSVSDFNDLRSVAVIEVVDTP